MKRWVFKYRIEEIAPYIDWSYMLFAWGLTGKADAKAATEEIIKEAKTMLAEAGGAECCHAVFALCEAKGCGDDIIVEGKRIPLLRQQHSRPGEPNLCLSDFVSPHGDHAGLFATAVSDEFVAEYSNDAYRHLLAQTLADRLAEATATYMHMQVRTYRELWGYAPDERLSIEELNAEKYQGIRPAVGYPSLPDQSIIFAIDKLLRLADAGIELTGNGAMRPHAAVCGMMIKHPASRYFNIGEISEEQCADYAKRRGVPIDEIRKFLSKNIHKRDTR